MLKCSPTEDTLEFVRHVGANSWRSLDKHGTGMARLQGSCLLPTFSCLLCIFDLKFSNRHRKSL